MVFDLEGKKLVDRLERLGIMRYDSYLSSSFCRHVGVCNLALLLLHHRDAGRNRIVDEHRDFKVIRVEHSGDMLEMFSDLVPGGRIRATIGIDRDDAAVGQ